MWVVSLLKLRSNRRTHMPYKKIRVLLAESQTLLRQGVKMLIDALVDMEVVDVDISMQELNGIEGTRQICDELIGTKALALSMHKDSVSVRESLRAGLAGISLRIPRTMTS